MIGVSAADHGASLGEHGPVEPPGTAQPVFRSGRLIQRRHLELALWMSPVLLVTALAISKRWTFDDGFIYFRSVEQILAGNGPVFNAGERVESFTSPVWLALLTVGDIVSPLRLEYTAAVLSIGCTVVGMWLATLGSARLADSDRTTSDSIRVPLGSVIFAALWPVWVWATSGLEVGLTYAWIGACLFVLAKWATDGQSLAASGLVLLGMGWLVRPELVVSSCVFVAVVVALSGLSPRSAIRATVIAFALPVTYQIFRMGYYGLLVSSPAIAKEGAAANPEAGWNYFKDFTGPYVLVVPLLATAFGVAVPFVRRLLRAKLTRPAATAIAVSGSGLLNAGAVVMIGGDYVHARLLLPSLFAFVAPFFVVAATIRNLEVLVGVGVWATMSIFVFRPSPEARGNVLGHGHLGLLTYQDHGFRQRGPDQPWINGPGLYVAHLVGGGGDRTPLELSDPDEIAVATYSLGAVGYALGPDVRVVDMWGLADPLTGHRRLDVRGIPGHEKSAGGPWLVARLARVPSLVLPNGLDAAGPFDPRHVGLAYAEQVAWAQAALQCPSIERLVASYDEPLSVARFFGNVWNAPANNSLRIAYVPEDAFREECSELDIPSSVAEFRARPEFEMELPPVSTHGDVVVVNDCAASYFATGQHSDPWVPIDAATFNVTVRFDAADTTPRLAAVWILRPYGEATAIIWAETDGQGAFRLRLDIDWFPPVLQDWTRIPADELVEVQLGSDLTRREWLLMANDLTIGAAPMTSMNESATAIIPEAAGPSSSAGTIIVDHSDPQISPECSAFAEAE